MPPAAQAERHAPVYVGVFFTFAPVGFLLGLMPEQPWGWGMSLLSAVFGGLLSVLWSWTFQSKRYWMAPILIIGSATSGWWLFWPFARLGLSDVGLSLDPFSRRVLLMTFSIASLAVGFTILIRVMSSNERRAARLQTELDLASRIHKTIVPPIEADAGFVRVFGRSDASSEMGGDLIDLIRRDGSADLYLADVAGHGVRAGVLMAMLKSALRGALLDDGPPPPLDAVARTLNRVIGQVAEPDMFATFACLRIDSSRRVEYALAGHWPILYFRAADRRLEELPGESMPLGVDPGERFVASSLTAAPGDLFVLLTDGLLEVADAEGRPIGLEAVKGRLFELAGRPLTEIHDGLLGMVRSHGSQTDDQTLLLARVV